MVKKALGIDKKPQFLRAAVLESAANTYTEQVFSTPNMTEAGYVMEILKIFWQQKINWGLADADVAKWSLHEGTRPAMPTIDEAGTIAVYRSQCGATSGVNLASGVIDLTDGDGNGLLTARKELILATEGVSQTGALSIGIAILYRLVKVSAAEIVGLIST